jgi:hypothetical protein
MKKPIGWKLRQRFGIAAPRVAVRLQMPWYLRWLAIGVLLVAGGVLSFAIYEAAIGFGWRERISEQQQRAALQAALDAARGELERLRFLSDAAESKLSIERTAQQKLAQQIRSLESENAKLREDLAIFEAMLSGGSRGSAPLAIRRFAVDPVAKGEYRYRLIVLASGTARSSFRGRYELLVRTAGDGRSAMITLPEGADSAQAPFGLDFKHFQKVDGTFRVPGAARVESVEVRVYETGSPQVRASEVVQPG